MCLVAALAGTLTPVLTTSAASGRTVGTTAPSGTTAFWGDAPIAAAVMGRDRRSVELGTAFTPRVDGTVAGVRFWKSSGNKGTHVGTLWGPAGTTLATATFADETVSGWQDVVFSTPVPVKAGTRYVASHHAPRGHHVMSQRLRGASTTMDLRFVPGRTGVFSYGPRGTYPSASWRSSQLWVDVMFTPAGSARPKPAPSPRARAVPPPPSGTQAPEPSTAPSTVPSPSPSPSATRPASPSPTPFPAPAPAPAPLPNPSSWPAPTPSPDPAPTPSPAGSTGRFPTAATTGVSANWQPRQTVTGDFVVSTPGAVVEDLRLTNGTLHVRAKNVTLRRVEVSGGQINNYWSGVCYGGLRIEDTTIVRGGNDIGQPVIQYGGYTAVRVKIDGTSEGLRVGAKNSGCGDTLIEDSWVHVTPYDNCVANKVDWHGDGLQGYEGGDVTIRNSYVGLESATGCVGNSAIFYPDQGNTRITLDNVLAKGGGFTVRIETPGTVSGLKVVDDSWNFGPKQIACDLVTWGSGNAYVRLAPDGTTTDLAPLPCSGW